MGQINALDIIEALAQASLVSFRTHGGVRYNPGDIIFSLAFIPSPVQVAVRLTLRRMDGEHSEGLVVSSARVDSTTREGVKQYLCQRVDELFDTVEAMPPEVPRERRTLKGQLGQSG